jgi:hypothetical protein
VDVDAIVTVHAQKCKALDDEKEKCDKNTKSAGGDGGKNQKNFSPEKKQDQTQTTMQESQLIVLIVPICQCIELNLNWHNMEGKKGRGGE